MPSGFNIETIEAYSKWSNMLQLAFGLLSILAYVSVNVVQTRFFPIQVYTEGGEQKVDFQPGVYQTLQIVQGSMSLASALLFLGRDTFCVSKRIQINRRPAHQLCYDWAYGMRISIFLSFASSVVSIAGMVMSLIELLDVSKFDCVDVQSLEFLCGGTLSVDSFQLQLQADALENEFTISCLEKDVRTYVPMAYVIIYAVTIVLGALGAHSAYFTYKFYMSEADN